MVSKAKDELREKQRQVQLSQQHQQQQVTEQVNSTGEMFSHHRRHHEVVLTSMSIAISAS